MKYKKGQIDGVIVKKLVKYIDERGWLSETFRHDEIEDENNYPVMSYSSVTYPGIARGPHEHVDQTDYFVFIGPSDFKVYLWDSRKDSSTYGNKMYIAGGENNPISVIVPPGVVHAYKNIGINPGLVLNFPNQLFMGENKKEQVDEIRHEDDKNSPYILD